MCCATDFDELLPGWNIKLFDVLFNVVVELLIINCLPILLYSLKHVQVQRKLKSMNYASYGSLRKNVNVSSNESVYSRRYMFNCVDNEIGDLWRRAVDCGHGGHGGATTRRPSLATRT